MARAMLSEPAILVADEPTQGVDVGARAEIYRILREVSDSGVPVVVASSDALELEGLCDRVIVMSRGQAVATLEGDDVTEERIVHAAISATAHSRGAADAQVDRLVAAHAVHRGRLRARSSSSPRSCSRWAPTSCSQNDRYLSDFNINSVMFACAALGFISLGQTFALLLGGIDLSVGPLAGFLVVLASFFMLDGQVAGGLGARLRPDVRVRSRGRPPQRVADPLREVHPGRGDARHVHRARRPRLHAARRSRRLHRHLGDRRDLHEGRPGPDRFRRCSSSARSPWSSGSAGDELGLRLRAVGSDEESARRVGVPRQPDGADRLCRRLAPDAPRRGRPARAARRRRPRPGHGLHADVDHRRRPRRHEPARRPRHLHRHAAWAPG